MIVEECNDIGKNEVVRALRKVIHVVDKLY